MWGRIGRALDRVYLWCGYLAVVALLLMTVLVLTSIIIRLLSIYIPGIGPYAGYAMAASYFFALAYTFRSNGHIRVNLLLSRLRKGTRRGAELWCLSVMALISVYAAYYLCKLAFVSWQFDEVSEGSDAMLLWIPQVPVAAGSVVLAVAVIHQLVATIFDPDAVERLEKAGGDGGHG